MTMSGSSLFGSKTEWNPSSLFHQLGQQMPLKPVVSSNSNSAPFPLHSALFSSSPTPSNNVRPMTGSSELDQRIRSFSASLMMSNRRVQNKKRPRNQATRYRLVGQVLGQKGVQKVVATVKEIKQLQAITEQQQQPKSECESQSAAVKNLLCDTVLVDAWENTPMDDLKSLPWEEMLRTSLEHLEAYHVWKAASE
jgi:hypothetical protein